MATDGASVGLQGVIVLMMIWLRGDITQMRGDMNKRINRVDRRIDVLVVQVSGSNRVVLP